MNTLNDERTDYEKGPEYERVLREVLKVIDTMHYGHPVEFAGVEAEDQPNPEHCFGPFEECYDGEVVVWPDLAWAKDQIVKALAS